MFRLFFYFIYIYFFFSVLFALASDKEPLCLPCYSVTLTSAFLYSYESRASFNTRGGILFRIEGGKKKWDTSMDYVEGEIGFLLFNDSFIHEHNSFISTLSLTINVANFQNQKTWILIFFFRLIVIWILMEDQILKDSREKKKESSYSPSRIAWQSEITWRREIAEVPNLCLPRNIICVVYAGERKNGRKSRLLVAYFTRVGWNRTREKR